MSADETFAAALYLERSGHGHYSYQPDETRRALTVLKDYLCEIQGVTWSDVCQMVREVQEEREQAASRSPRRGCEPEFRREQR